MVESVFEIPCSTEGPLQIIVCVGYRDEDVINNIMLNTIIEHRVSPCNLFCKFLLLNLFRLAITKGLNTY